MRTLAATRTRRLAAGASVIAAAAVARLFQGDLGGRVRSSARLVRGRVRRAGAPGVHAGRLCPIRAVAGTLAVILSSLWTSVGTATAFGIPTAHTWHVVQADLRAARPLLGQFAVPLHSRPRTRVPGGDGLWRGGLLASVLLRASDNRDRLYPGLALLGPLGLLAFACSQSTAGSMAVLVVLFVAAAALTLTTARAAPAQPTHGNRGGAWASSGRTDRVHHGGGRPRGGGGDASAKGSRVLGSRAWRRRAADRGVADLESGLGRGARRQRRACSRRTAATAPIGRSPSSTSCATACGFPIRARRRRRTAPPRARQSRPARPRARAREQVLHASDSPDDRTRKPDLASAPGDGLAGGNDGHVDGRGRRLAHPDDVGAAATLTLSAPPVTQPGVTRRQCARRGRPAVPRAGRDRAARPSTEHRRRWPDPSRSAPRVHSPRPSSSSTGSAPASFTTPSILRRPQRAPIRWSAFSPRPVRAAVEQFAGAYVALARSLGLPSRVVVGFTSGRYSGPGEVSVRGADAHAWPQVYLGLDAPGGCPSSPHRNNPAVKWPPRAWWVPPA